MTAPRLRGAAGFCGEGPNAESVVAVVAMVPVVGMVPLAALAIRGLCAHRKAARFAELRPLAQHARLDLRLVGNEFAAKPHGIGRAGFAGCIAALGAGDAKAAKQDSNRQRQRAD